MKMYVVTSISPNAPPGSTQTKPLYLRKCSMSERDMELNSKPYSYMWGNDDFY